MRIATGVPKHAGKFHGEDRGIPEIVAASLLAQM
jgi:hypothetical protein